MEQGSSIQSVYTEKIKMSEKIKCNMKAREKVIIKSKTYGDSFGLVLHRGCHPEKDELGRYYGYIVRELKSSETGSPNKVYVVNYTSEGIHGGDFYHATDLEPYYMIKLDDELFEI